MAEFISDTHIEILIQDLASPYRVTRRQARETLVQMGSVTVAPLMEALVNPNYHMRWEAVHALGEIGDPVAAPVLVKCLEDERLEVRWRAAEDLIVFKEAGLVPLLQALSDHPDSIRLREGARHVLRVLVTTPLKGVAAPVLTTLEAIEPAVMVPQVARTALEALRELEN